MKYLTLKVADIDGKNALYDFSGADSDITTEEILGYVEDVLFGNDALFAGVIELKADIDGEEYIVCRDFSKDVTVYRNGESSEGEAAEKALSKIAALGRKQWKDNTVPCDAELFSQDPAEYVKKYLSGMGFDSEELEIRSNENLSKADVLVTKADALSELISDGAAEKAKEVGEKIEVLKTECSSLCSSEQVARENEVVNAKIAAVEAEIAELRSKEEEIAEKREKIKKNQEIIDKNQAQEKIAELLTERDGLKAEVDSLTSELEELQKKTEEAKERNKAREEKYKTLNEETETLREEFFKLLANNADSGEITEYALERVPANREKTEALDEFMVWDEKFLEISKQLGDSRFDYLKKRSIREGVAFESALDDRNDRLQTVTEVLKIQNDAVEAMSKEIEQSRALLDSTNGHSLSDADAKRLSLHEKTVNVRLLGLDVAAIKVKIKENEDALAAIDEDVAAIEQARKVVVAIVEKCEKERVELETRISAARARLNLSRGVENLEYGAVCPVCNGIISDKAAIAKEDGKIRPLLERLVAANEENNTLYAEYREKLEKIDARMGQLKERRTICNTYLRSLNEALSAKETALSAILTGESVGTLPALERKAESQDAEFLKMCSVGDGEFLSRHIEYLEGQVALIKEKTAPLAQHAEELKRQIADMGGAYDGEILPALEGRKAYSYLDEIVATEQGEDELLARLTEADEKRAQALEKYLEAERNDAPQLVNVTGAIIAEAFADIRKSEESAMAAREEWLSDKEVEELENTTAEKAAKANELMNEAEEINSRVEEITPIAEAELDGVVLSEEEIEKLSAEIAEYDEKTVILNAQNEILKSMIVPNDYDSARHAEVKAEISASKEELAELEKKAAVSEAAEKIVKKDLSTADALREKAKILRMLADGDISDVIMPILNDVLVMCGEEAIASSDGYGLKFTLEGRKKTRTMSAESVDDDGNLSTAVDCALNYVLRLASDSEAVRFIANRDIPEAVADKYGLINIK